LVVQSMKLLLDQLQPDDTVAIVTYAGNAGTALEPTAVRDKETILSALDNLTAYGSTAGAEGIRQAYNLAEAHFDKKSVNRVILATDGDFNVGITDPNELKSFIERERDTGIYLSVLAVGEGNLNDQLMQDLAQNGNGVAAYIDNLNEARKVLVKESTSTLFPIAKDVKIQVEFNPATVSEYRLIGYETRHLNREDFNNDKVDAGDIGAGHAVTALYEITPAGSENRLVDDSRYQKEAAPALVRASKGDSEFAFLKIRYKLPDENTSKLITTPITKADDISGEEKAGWKAVDPGWAAAVAGFGQILRGGKYTGDFNYDDVITLAQAHKGRDEYGYRSEFIQLVRLAKSAAKIPKN
jgi:Ca-activated chloride channel homolog